MTCQCVGAVNIRKFVAVLCGVYCWWQCAKILYTIIRFIITTRSKLRKVLFYHCLWLLCFFCLWTKYLRNRWTDLRQIHMEDVFGRSFGRVWMSKVAVTKDNKTRCALPSPPAATEWNALAANVVMQQQMDYSFVARGWFWQAACGLCLIKSLQL